MHALHLRCGKSVRPTVAMGTSSQVVLALGISKADPEQRWHGTVVFVSSSFYSFAAMCDAFIDILTQVDTDAEELSMRDKIRVNDLLWQQFLMLLYLAMLIKPFRRGSKTLMCAFRSVDRPEDRPYTLAWIFSQTLVIEVFICYMFIWLLTKEDKLSLVFLPLIVSNIGDGLAEPVGIRYGAYTPPERGR